MSWPARTRRIPSSGLGNDPPSQLPTGGPYRPGMAKLKDLLTKIKKPGAATVGDVSTQVDKWTRARADAVRSLEALATTRRELLLAGDEGALDQLDEKE